MRPFLAIAAGLLLLAGVGTALAQDDDSSDAVGLHNFAGLRGSLAFGGDLHTQNPTPVHEDASLQNGYGGSVYIGTRLGWGLRLEGEGLYRYTPLSGIAVNGNATAAHGYASAIAPMLNLLWDLPVDPYPVHPFIGAGVGGAYTLADIHDDAGDDFLRKNHWNLAYQLLGGLAMPLNASSRVTAMYRWMRINNAGFKCAAAGPASGSCVSDITNTSVDLGLEMDM